MTGLSDGDHVFYLIRNVYRDHKAKADATRRAQVYFEQLRGGSVVDPKRIDELLTALLRLRNSGDLDTDKVMVGIGPVTNATTPQIAWIGSLGVYAIVQFNQGNLAENARTIPSLIYYQCGIVPAAGGLWDLEEQYRRLRSSIEAILADSSAIHIHATHAAERGAPVPGDPLVRALRVHDLTQGELDRFLHAYEKTHADAERYALARGDGD